MNIYIYVKNEIVNEFVKYGIKLSSNYNVKLDNKIGILAYFSPKDSNLYNNNDYSILRIKSQNSKIYVHNSPVISNYNYSLDNCLAFEKYTLGEYINPELIITSSILPENIFKYNKIKDVPLLIDTSTELYINRAQELEFENNSCDMTFDKLKNT